MNDDWITTREAAALLKISPQALNGLARRARIASAKLGNARVYRRAAILDLLGSETYRQTTRRRATLQDFLDAGQLTLGSELDQ